MSIPSLPNDGPMPVTGRIGGILRKYREEQNRSQEEVARAADMSPMGLHYIETRLRSTTLNTVERISWALHKPLAVVVLEASLNEPPED